MLSPAKHLQFCCAMKPCPGAPGLAAELPLRVEPLRVTGESLQQSSGKLPLQNTADAPRPIRVVHVLGSLNRGGAEAWLMDVVRRVGRDKLAVDVCLLQEERGAYEEEFASLGGRILRCPLGRNPIAFSRSFGKLIRAGNYDVVHSHLYYFSGWLLRTAAKAGIRGRVAHVHRSADLAQPSALRSLYTRWMRRWIERYSTAVAGPSQASLAAFWGPRWADDPRRRVLYNGIRVERFQAAPDRASVRRELGLPSQARIVLNVSRFVWHKRQEWLLHVAKELVRQDENAYFVLIGDGPQREPVQRKAAEMGLTERFRFLSAGPPEIDRYWLAADAFAFPSVSEGFGIVVAEAGAAGLPVVACDIPGVQEAVAACEDAALLPVDASPKQWAEALAQSLGRPRQAAAERQAALAHFPFTIESSIQSLLDLYESACRQTATR